MEPSQLSSDHLAASRRKVPRFGAILDAGMLAANLAGVMLYLRAASLSWAIPAERAAGITSVTGEPFIWALGVLPIWGVFVVADLAWAVLRRRHAKPSNLVVALAVVGIWVAAFAVDFSRH